MGVDQSKPKFRGHIAIFLAPAALVYTAVTIHPLFTEVDQEWIYVDLENFRTLFGNIVWSTQVWNALGNNLWFFVIHMLVQNPRGIALAAILSHPRLRFASFYRSAIFIPGTFFGFQLQLGDPHMGSAIASAMFVIILIGVCFYLFGIQTRMRRYQFQWHLPVKTA